MSEPLRVCRVCGLEAWTEEDLERFTKSKSCPHGRTTTCKKCQNERIRIYRLNNPTLDKNRNRIYHKKYYQKNREEILAKAKQQRQTPKYKQARQAWTEKNRERIRQQAKEYFQKNKGAINRQRNKRREKDRETVLEKMGGKCVRCDFSDIRALQIDHIHGGGSEEMRKTGQYYFYRCIIKMSEKEWKSQYQLLCANCNSIKKYERGEFRAKAEHTLHSG